jgi:glycine oxidase
MAIDTLIIGGGVMGCGVALRLAQAGQSVVVLERAIPGAEASSAAAGILAPQAECDAPGPLLDLGLRSRSLYPALAEELRQLTGIDVGFRSCGVLEVAATKEGLAKLEERARWQERAGLRLERLTASQVRSLEPELTGPIEGALWLADEGQVDNRALVNALSIAAAKVGARFQTGLVRSVWVEEGRARGVELEDERLEANAVVLAAGAWSALVPGTGGWATQVIPARGQMVQLETRPPLLSRVVFTERGYLVPRVDGRLLVGSTLEFVGFEKRVTASGLRELLGLAVDIAPALAKAPVVDSWAGFRPYSRDGRPLLGPGPIADLFFATGHHRNGILLAPVTAELVANAVLRRALPLSLEAFRPDRAEAARA